MSVAWRSEGPRAPEVAIDQGRDMQFTRRRVLLAVLAAGALAAIPLFAASGSPSAVHVTKATTGFENAADTPGEGPAAGFEAWQASIRTYPADVIPPELTQTAEGTFAAIASKDAAHGDPKGDGQEVAAVRPAAARHPARRDRLLRRDEQTRRAASRRSSSRPTAAPRAAVHRLGRRRRAAASGAPTTRPAANPNWRQLTSDELDQNSVGALYARPDRQEGQDALPRHGRGQPLLVRL